MAGRAALYYVRECFDGGLISVSADGLDFRELKMFQKLFINLLRHVFADGIVGPSKRVLKVEVNAPVPVLLPIAWSAQSSI